MRCAAITRAGELCRLDATSGSYCWSHAPENAAARKARGRRGGKARGAGEVVQVKKEIRAVIGGVLNENIPRPVGAVLFQGFNSLLRALETERRLRELDEIEERLEALEAREAAGKNAWRGNR